MLIRSSVYGHDISASWQDLALEDRVRKHTIASVCLNSKRYRLLCTPPDCVVFLETNNDSVPNACTACTMILRLIHIEMRPQHHKLSLSKLLTLFPSLPETRESW